MVRRAVKINKKKNRKNNKNKNKLKSNDGNLSSRAQKKSEDPRQEADDETEDFEPAAQNLDEFNFFKEINSSIQKKSQMRDFEDDISIEVTKRSVIQTVGELQEMLTKQKEINASQIGSQPIEESKSVSNKEAFEKLETKTQSVPMQDNITFDITETPFIQSVDDYNKSIEDLNNRQFDEKVDELSNNEEQIENISESQRLKIDEENDKFDDSNASNLLIQETRSEEGKEDQNKLEEPEQKIHMKQVFQENKPKRNSEKGKFVDSKIKSNRSKKANSKQTKQSKTQLDQPVKLEEVKQNESLKKSYGSEPENEFQSSHQEDVDLQEIYNDPSFANSSEKNLNKHLSYTADVKSVLSEDKNQNEGVKHVHSTNPTSETSSFKNSSVASNQDIKPSPSNKKNHEEQKMLKQNERKLKEKGGDKKPKKPLKSDRPKYRSDSDKNQEMGVKRSNSKSNIPSDSIWNQDLEDALFPEKSKKSVKQKKKLKEKKNKNQTASEVKSEDKSLNEAKKQNSDSKQPKVKRQKEVKESKDFEIEEKKIDLSVKPFTPQAALPKPSSKSSKPKQSEEAKQIPQPKVQKHKSSNFHKNKKFSNDEFKHHNIPYETVSSFYQLDDEYSNTNKFSKNKSQVYNHGYANDMTGYSQEYGQSFNHDYSHNEHAFYDYNHMDKVNAIPEQPMDPLQIRQYDCEQFLYETLSKEIEVAAEEITSQVNMIKDYRYDIKLQLEEIAYETFKVAHTNVQAHIYGSVATGLALPESDMDIVITGVSSFGSKENHAFNISLLFENILGKFSSKILVKSQKILQTQVPIIKITFDLSEYYDEVMKYDPIRLPYVNFESIDLINPSLKELAVDVSI